MSESRASARRIKAVQRRTEAVELRVAGLTYREIGERLQCSTAMAHKIVTEELQRLTRERAQAAGTLSQLENERLDRLHTALWPQAAAGDMDAVNTILRLMNRRAKLLGLDVPATLGVNVNRLPTVPLTVVEEVVSNEPAVEGAVAQGTEALPRE
jgi:hypothetical protein